ncbi:hypothetical protein [Shewanella donghaensis]|uniref:hypothetical protein n=1 Tax=Shewanella donghaensis TaxID=238836 RepID=UPI0011830975|nr:hypothetical protein [Shewanella donghaensis]
MQLDKLKSKAPFISLICVSAAWIIFFKYDLWINDYGAAQFDWLMLIDGLITLPLVCFYCLKSKKLAFVKSLGYFALLILLGSYIIPAKNQLIWPYLTQIRYLLIGGFILIELVSIACVLLAIKTALKSGEDPDIAIDNSIKGLFGDSIIATIVAFEVRVWSFFLCAHLINASSYRGEVKFSYHKKDDNQSNAFGFIMMIAFEIPLMHIVIHFIFSSLTANIVTGLTLFSLVFFIAEYRAMSRRPISISHKNNSVGCYERQLHIRYGVFNCYSIKLNNIQSVELNSERVRRAEGLKRFNFSGVPNVKINLVVPIANVKSVFIGVDNPNALIQALSNESISLS